MKGSTKSKPLLAQNRVYDCSCRKDQNATDCPFSNRCVEPLAWNIEHESMSSQNQCALYTRVPKEIRDMIWEYALTDCTSYNPFDDASPAAVNLLRTCRAIYLETWALPRILSLCTFRNTTPTRVLRHFFLPWQFACLSKLEINVQQTILEGPELRNDFQDGGKWCLQERHKGAYLGPRFFCIGRRSIVLDELPRTFNIALLPANTADKRTIHKHYVDLLRTSLTQFDDNFPWWSEMQVMKAQPFTHLTLRLGRNDWWTWTDYPNSTDPAKFLGLDPACGNGSAVNECRPTSDRMHWLANERRAGRHPTIKDHPNTWLSFVGQFLDLKCLELVLETYGEKRHQLEAVVECAKTWKFPIIDTPFELVWSGPIGTERWGKMSTPWSKYGNMWHERSTAYEVQIVQFTRKRAA